MKQAADQRPVEAVRAGDEVAVGQALADGADPNILVGRFRGSVLAEAAGSGRLEIVDMLEELNRQLGR
ncbi:hypothetical protein [Pseudofrankia sp. BMG5.37]|uniref:hypothetical protein n=1 Tax=Pseudofrankia sp. BMG5.37 TaxID=3050035 RepID=UPI00289405B1|nr:hypothetical protein [Pseudofrankia sp. BMG5.37]MDT3443554.1 hypothetical protein [Pseudofrankia sp. BMG5.37]